MKRTYVREVASHYDRHGRRHFYTEQLTGPGFRLSRLSPRRRVELALAAAFALVVLYVIATSVVPSVGTGPSRGCRPALSVTAAGENPRQAGVPGAPGTCR